MLGVCKAQTTRVGNGPFPTELGGPQGDALRERGGEYGVNTGRPRRCGWFDAATVRAGIRAGGIQALALTKLDVLDGMAEVKVATGYRFKGQLLKEPPASLSADLEPVYESLPGWSQPTAGVANFHDLPTEAQIFVRRIEELTGIPVTMISTGAHRDDTIVRECPFGVVAESSPVL